MDTPGSKIDSADLAKPESVWPVYAFLALIFSVFIVLALQSYRSIDQELTDSALSRRLSIAELAAATLTEKFDRMTGIGIALATRVQFRKLVTEEKWVEAAQILKDVPKDFPFVERLFLADIDGILMANIPELPGVVGNDFSYRDWYTGVSRNWEPYISPVYKRAAAPQRNVFAVAIPIKDSDDNPLGILVLHTDLEAFFTWVKTIDVGPGGFVYVVDSKGQLAFHPKYPAQGEIISFSEVPIVQEVLQGKANVEISYNPIEKEQRVSAYMPVEYGWGVIAQQPVRTTFEFKDKQLNRIMTGYVLILSFCILVIWLAIRILRQRQQAEEDRRVMSELERRVAERTQQLEATNKELESFSYSVSHDLRSPLRAIEGFSQILAEEQGDKLDAEGRRLLAVVKDNARRMNMLIDDLLALSRLGRQAIKPMQINMNDLVKEVYEELQDQSGTAKSVRFVAHPLPEARADRSLIRQVWMNLLSNAVKYSSACAESIIEVGGHSDGSEIVYYVRDNGAGFDMQYYNKLFSVFQRLHRLEDFPGTGIGLAIIKRVITRHGGRVWAEGKINEGATFYFSLPRGK